MVSTRQAGKTRKPTGKASSPADSGDEYEERTPQPSKTGGTKRARASKTAVKDKKQEKRRKTAKLSMLPGVPIDILYEVRGSLLHHTFPDAKRLPDIFSRPPKRINADLLDFENLQWLSYQEVIAARLAGLIRDDSGEREAATLSFRDYRNGIREPFVWPTLHGLYISCQSLCLPI